MSTLSFGYSFSINRRFLATSPTACFDALFDFARGDGLLGSHRRLLRAEAALPYALGPGLLLGVPWDVLDTCSFRRQDTKF